MPKLGYKHSQEHNKNLSISLKGRKLSREHIKNRTIAQNGKNHPNWKDGRSGNKEYRVWLKNKRNRDLRSCGGSHSFGEWENLKAQYNWTCPACRRKEPIISLTQDHIIPVSRGGSNNIENIQPLCKSCNSHKSNKVIIKYEVRL